MSSPNPIPPAPQSPAPPKRTRAEANRANAQKSTGPRTAAGKSASRFNALTHGLTSRELPLLPTEDPASFKHFHKEMFQQLAPIGPEETSLAETIVTHHWRIRRIPALEAALLAPSPETPAAQTLLDHPRALTSLSLHEQRLSRLLHQAHAALAELQSARRARENEDIVQAVELRKYFKHKNFLFSPANLGFVFSTEEIDRYSNRCYLNQASHNYVLQSDFAIASPDARPRDARLPAKASKSKA